MSFLSPLKSTQFAYGSEFYELADEYDSGVSGWSGDFEYYGYVNNIGKWIIQRHQISTGAWRFLNGANTYSTYWTNAISGSLTGYDYLYKMSNTTP
jgi:hypothetical protein